VGGFIYGLDSYGQTHSRILGEAEATETPVVSCRKGVSILKSNLKNVSLELGGTSLPVFLRFRDVEGLM
jgi:hypothetical protein